MLGHRKFHTAEDTQYGDFSVFADSDILGKNASTDYFYNFWNSLERPCREDIKPGKMARYLDRVVLMDIQELNGRLALSVRLIGTFVASYYGEITGKDIRAMPNKQAADRIYHICNMVLEQKKPLMTVTPAFAADKQYLEAYALYMPLFDESGSIEKILVCVDISSLNPS